MNPTTCARVAQPRGTPQGASRRTRAEKSHFGGCHKTACFRVWWVGCTSCPFSVGPSVSGLGFGMSCSIVAPGFLHGDGEKRVLL